MNQARKQLPGNAIKARTAIFVGMNAAGERVRLATNEVARVPQVISEQQAIHLTRNVRCDWLKVEAGFPDRAIVDEDLQVLHDMSKVDSAAERSRIEREDTIRREQGGIADNVALDVGDTSADVEHRDAPRTARRGRK